MPDALCFVPNLESTLQAPAIYSRDRARGVLVVVQMTVLPKWYTKLVVDLQLLAQSHSSNTSQAAWQSLCAMLAAGGVAWLGQDQVSRSPQAASACTAVRRLPGMFRQKGLDVEVFVLLLRHVIFHIISTVLRLLWWLVGERY